MIGAVGNNGVGEAGINWSIRLMAVRIRAAGGAGTDIVNANAAAGIDYAVSSGAPISNNSWRAADGGYFYSQEIYDAIARAQQAGHLFVGGAGNDGSDNDATPFYPASYDLDNIISATAVDASNQALLNYGATSVDLGAPTPGGTSGATSHTSGVAALLKSVHPEWTYSQIKQRILSSVDPLASLAGKTVTGGRLNAANALGIAQFSISDATADEGSNAVTFLDTFIPDGSGGLARAGNVLFGPGGDLYVVSRDSDSVLRFDGETGAFENAVVPSGSEGLDHPWMMTFGPDGRLYVAGAHSNSIVRWDPVTDVVDTFIPSGAGLWTPKGMAFDDSGVMYVSNSDRGPDDASPLQDQVLKFAGPSGGPDGEAPGTFLGVFIGQGSGGLDNPNHIVIHDDHMYVTNTRGDSVNRYDAETGAFVDVFVPAMSGGLDIPNYMVFRPDGYLYISSQGTDEILRYDAATGAFADVIVPERDPSADAVIGLDFDAAGNLYVGKGATSEVLRYGAAAQAAFTVTLSAPAAEPVSVSYTSVSGTATSGSDFPTTSGTLTFAPGQTSRTILVQTLDDAVYEGNETFTVNLVNSVGGVIVDGEAVATIEDNESPPQISMSNATADEGSSAIKFIDAFITPGSGGLKEARGIEYGADGNLYLNRESFHTDPIQQGYVQRYDGVTGAFIDIFATHPDMTGAKDVEFGPDGNLYVPNNVGDNVYRFNGTTGEFIDVFIPTGSGGLDTPRSLIFGPDGNGDGNSDIYITSAQTDSILRFDGFTGSFIDAFIPTASGGLNDPTALVFGPDGDLYVASGAHSDFFNGILRYDGSTGAFEGVFVAPGSAGLTLAPTAGVIFGPDINADGAGDLYVSNGEVDEVLVYNGLTGAFLQKYITPGLGGLDSPKGLLFDHDGNLLVVNNGDHSVRRYGPSSQAAFTVTLSAPSETTVTVDFSTSIGTANGSDFIAASGTLTFAPGQTSRTILVQTLDDATYEGNETFTVNLSNPVGGAIVDGQGVGTIVDDDPQPTKFYVVDDASANRTYEYGAAGNSVENYSLNSGNSAPRGAASTAAGERVWVVDGSRKVFVYDDAGGLVGSWTAGSLASSADEQGIATNGTDVWIVDAKSDKVFRYAGAASRLSGSQNAASSFNLNSGNRKPSDIVTDGTHLWVLNNNTNDKVFKYTLSGSLVGSWTIAGGGTPTGITLDPANPSHLWIVDSSADRVYQYDNAVTRISGSQAASTSFALAAGNSNPQGIADPPVPGQADGDVLSVPGQQLWARAVDRVFAARPETGSSLSTIPAAGQQRDRGEQASLRRRRIEASESWSVADKEEPPAGSVHAEAADEAITSFEDEEGLLGRWWTRRHHSGTRFGPG
jgi:hypothetical protein